MNRMTTKKTEEQKAPVFSKSQLLSAKQFHNRKDILGVVLEDGKEYSFEQAESLIEKYMKGKVN